MWKQSKEAVDKIWKYRKQWWEK